MLYLLDQIITNGIRYDDYNKIIYERLNKNLSVTTSQLIITTVTGDQNYLQNSTKKIFKDLGILHLVALSGSNIVIYLWFIRIFRSKGSNSYMFLLTVLLLLYFIFTRQLHPLARAITFMTLVELYYQSGVEKHQVRFRIILAIIVMYLLLWSSYSMSMVLSLIFSISIYFYDYLKLNFFPFFDKLLNHLSFSIYMFFISIPVYIFVFKTDPTPILLFSNLVISPLFEITLYMYYVLYILFLSFDFTLPIYFTQIIDLPAFYIEALYTILTR